MLFQILNSQKQINMNDLSKLLNPGTSSTKRHLGDSKSKSSSNTTLMDALRLKRLRRELIASKKTLIALDCDFAIAELEKEKELQKVIQQKKESKELIDSYLKYGFDNENNALITQDEAVRQPFKLKVEGGQLAVEAGESAENQMIKRIVMTRKESIGAVVREGNFSQFKLHDNKESVNIKKIGKSPEKAVDEPYHTIMHDDSIIQLRSQSVIQQQKGIIHRFYNFDKERSKSKINQLLSQPIEIPNPNDSSFLTDGLSRKKSMKGSSNQSSVVLPQIVKPQSRNIDLNSAYQTAVPPQHHQRLLPVKSDPQAIRLFNDSNASTSRNLSLNKLTSKVSVQPDIRIIVSRPEEEEEAARRLKFEFIKENEKRPDSRTQRLRKIAKDVSKEKSTFKRQNILFDLVDQAQEDVIGIKPETKLEQDPRKGSPLKSEEPNSSVIRMVEPQYPLKSDFDFTQLNKGVTKEMHDQRTQFQINQIIEKKDLVTFSKNLPINKNFEISNINYSRKMTDLNSILQMRMNQIEDQCLNEDKIYAQFQKSLIQQTKQNGAKLYSDKRFSDFDILVWPEMITLQDHRNIKISKTGYQIDEEMIKDLEGEGSIEKSQERKQFILEEFPKFQEYSNYVTNKRTKRHDRCLPKIQRKNDEPKKAEQEIPIIEKKDSHHSFRSHDRKLSSDISEEEQSPANRIKDQVHYFSHENHIQISKPSKEKDDDSPAHKTEITRQYSGKDKKSYQKSKKKTKEQFEREKEEELKRKAQIEHAEYQAEMMMIRAKELLESTKKFQEKKREELEEITRDIEICEVQAEDQYNLYESNLVNNAYSSAKKKISQNKIREEKLRNFMQKSGSKSQSPIKISLLPTSSVKSGTQQNTLVQITPQNKEQPSAFFNLTEVKQQMNLQPPQLKAQYDSPIQTKTPLDTEDLKQDRSAQLNQKVQTKIDEKEAYGKLIYEVYNKNENIDYDKKKLKLKQKEDRMRELDEYGAIVSGEKEYEDRNLTQEATDGENSSIMSEGSESEEERKAMQEMFQQEDLMEQEALKRKMAEEKKNNMERKYLQMCKNEKVLPLPIISKICEGVLCLDDYKLNFGLCKALSNVLDDLEDQIFKIDLRNNGISDSDFAEVIRGAIKNPHIKSFSLRNNEFRENSLKELLKYFELKVPILEELVISACKTKNSQMNELLKAMSDYNNMKSLSICQSKLDQTSVLYLADIANGNTLLRDLDLSWNQVSSIQMWELVQNIEFCRHISYLNLSFNSFIGSHTDEIVESLSNFIRRNRKLQHLDISYCGLKKDQVFEVVKSCKKSRSLHSVHLTGNLITDETKKKIREYMRPRKRIQDHYDMINDPDEQEAQSKTFSVGNIDLKKAILAKLKQVQEEQLKNQNDQQQNYGNDNPKANPGENLIFSRILGHFEIPRSHKWQESQECYLCERHRYSVVLLSKTIVQNYFVQPNKKDREAYMMKIKKAEERNTYKSDSIDGYGSDQDELYYDADSEEQKTHFWLNNLICGSFNRWKLRSVLPLGDFMRRLRKNREPPVNVINIDKDVYDKQVQELRQKAKMKEAERQKLRRKNLMMLDKAKVTFDDNPLNQTEWGDRLTDVDYENIKSSWLYEIQEYMPYKETVNMIIPFETLVDLNSKAGLISELKEKVYAFADYLPPGKHNSCFIYNTQNKPKKGLYSFMTNIMPRELPLDIKTKRVKEYRITRKFDKPTSMFKDFPEDNPTFLKKVFLKDIETWKLGRVIKDNLELRRLIDTMLIYIQQLKDIFNHCIALSSFPSISWIDFGNFCNQWKIPDNRTCTMQTIDRVFIATNVELVEQEDNPDRDLCRFEFYEILVRLGAAKYKDAGVVSTWDAAAKMIIEQNIIQKTTVMGGQSFRDQYIWNLQIDDLFRANVDSLQLLHNKYAADLKLTLNLDRCLQMIESLQIPEHEAKIAYSFSKMTIADEMNQKDRYDSMLLPELMDFICRCAFLKYQGMTNISFLEKVERILDILLKQVDKRRERPNFEVEVSSDSDYDTDD